MFMAMRVYLNTRNSADAKIAWQRLTQRASRSCTGLGGVLDFGSGSNSSEPARKFSARADSAAVGTRAKAS